jgi:heme/copper-type cytochrome/quinol oxidase subunit 2
VTSSDTIHEWHVPALGIKATAIPGRIESVDLKTSQLGTFAGNDNQRAAITVRIVSHAAFATWQRMCLAP